MDSLRLFFSFLDFNVKKKRETGRFGGLSVKFLDFRQGVLEKGLEMRTGWWEIHGAVFQPRGTRSPKTAETFVSHMEERANVKSLRTKIYSLAMMCSM